MSGDVREGDLWDFLMKCIVAIHQHGKQNPAQEAKDRSVCETYVSS